MQVLAAARPRWIDHLLLNEIFDGDMAYLAQASANSKRRDGFGNSWAQDYYLPARADGCADCYYFSLEIWSTLIKLARTLTGALAASTF